MKKRITSLFCCLVLLLSLFSTVFLASCGTSATNDHGDSSEAKESDDGNPVIVMVKKAEASGGPYLPDVLRTLAEKYTAEGNREVKIVELDPLVEEIGDQDYDIVIYDTSYWGDISPYSMMADKKLADLTPYLEKDENYNNADFVEPVLEAGKVGNSQLWLPVLYSVSVIAGDSTVSDEYGLPNGEDLLNYDSFWNKILNAGDNIPVFSNTTSYTDGDMNPYSTFLTGGGMLYDIQNKEAMFDADYFIKPLSVYNKYYAGNDIKAFGMTQSYPSVAAVTSGKGGLLYYDIGGAQNFLSCKVDNMRQSDSYFCGSVPYTEENAGKYSASVLSAIGISADSKRKDPAYDFLMYCYTSDELYVGLMNYDYLFPVKRSLIDSQCGTAIFQVEFLYGANAVTKYKLSADSLYQEVTNIGYAHFLDSKLNEVITASMGEANIGTDTIIANLGDNWSSLSGQYGIYK